MTYELIIPPGIQRQISTLPPSDQAELITLFDRLPTEHEAVTDVFGQDVPGPVRMCSAGLSRLIVVILVSDLSVTITVVELVDALAG